MWKPAVALVALPVFLMPGAPPRGAGNGGPATPVVPVSVGSVPAAGMGCQHTIKVRNAGTRTVSLRWENSEVRTKLGWWRRIYGAGVGIFRDPPDPPTFPVASGKSYSWIYETDFGCNANRRWRFRLERSDGKQYMLYYPSSSSFSSNTTVDLGDLGRASLWD